MTLLQQAKTRWRKTKIWWERQPPYLKSLYLALFVAAVIVTLLIWSFINFQLSWMYILLNAAVVLTNIISMFTYMTRLWLRYKQEGFSLEICVTLGIVILGMISSLFMVSHGVVDIKSQGYLTSEVAYTLFTTFTMGGGIGFAARVFGKDRSRAETISIRISAFISLMGGFTFIALQGWGSLGVLSHVGIFSVFGIYPPIALTFAMVALVQYLGKTLIYLRYKYTTISDADEKRRIEKNLKQYQYSAYGIGIGLLIAVVCAVLLFTVVANPFGGPILAVCMCVFVWVGCASFSSKVGEAIDQKRNEHKRTPSAPEQKEHPDTRSSDEQLGYALSDYLEPSGQCFARVHAYKVEQYENDITDHGAVLIKTTLAGHRSFLSDFNNSPSHEITRLATLAPMLEDIDCIAQAIVTAAAKPIPATNSELETLALREKKAKTIKEVNQTLTTINRDVITPLTTLLNNTITPNKLNTATLQNKRQLARLQQQLQHVTFDIKQAKKSETTPPVPGKHGLVQSYGGWLNLPNYFFSSIYTNVSLCRKRFWEILRDGYRIELDDNNRPIDDEERLSRSNKPIGRIRWLFSPFFLVILLAEWVSRAVATVGKALTTLIRHPKTGIAIVLFIAALALFSNPISATFTLIALAAIVTSTLLVFIDYQAQTAKHAELESFRPDHDVESSPTTISPGDIEQLIAVIQHFGPDIQQQTSYCFTRDLEILQGIQRQQHIQLQKHLSTSLNNDKRYEVYQIQKNLRRGIACLDTNHLHLWRNIGIAIFAALLLAGGLFLLFSPAAPASMLLLYSGFKITALLIAGVGIAGIVGGAQQALQIYQQQELLADVSPNSGLEVGGSSYSQIAIQQRGAKIERKYGQHTPVVPDHKSFISVVSGSTHHHLLNGHNANGGGSTPSSPEIKESKRGSTHNGEIGEGEMDVVSNGL